jgi:hypothetical protein
MNTVPQTLYSTPDPHQEISELYVINAEELATATDPKRRWVIREKHGYWDEQYKKFLLDVITLSPNDPKHCVTLEEAHIAVEKQVLVRVKSGFRFLFEWSPYGPPWFKRYEIMSDGTHKELY